MNTGSLRQVPRPRQKLLQQTLKKPKRRLRGDNNRRGPAVSPLERKQAAVSLHQRQRLCHQIKVRQYLRLQAFRHRRHQPRNRRHDHRQKDPSLRFRRRWQRLRAGVPGQRGPRLRNRSGPNLRTSSLHVRVLSCADIRRARYHRYLRNRHRKQGDHHF